MDRLVYYRRAGHTPASRSRPRVDLLALSAGSEEERRSLKVGSDATSKDRITLAQRNDFGSRCCPLARVVGCRRCLRRRRNRRRDCSLAFVEYRSFDLE